jgi:hypothetical protein
MRASGGTDDRSVELGTSLTGRGAGRGGRPLARVYTSTTSVWTKPAEVHRGLERRVLLAVVRLGDGTYGAEIQREFTARTGRDVTPGTIYPTLDRLEGNLLRSWMGEATPKGGGRDRPSVSVDSGLARALRAGAPSRRMDRGSRRGVARRGEGATNTNFKGPCLAMADTTMAGRSRRYAPSWR